MSLYSKAESGTFAPRSRFTIRERKIQDCDYGQLHTTMMKFVLPGDIWRINCNVFTRFQPMLAPTLTRNIGRVRYFFVPLRMVEEDAELVITGSKDGKFDVAVDLPEFESIDEVVDWDKVSKHSVADMFFGYPVDYSFETGRPSAASPAAYWLKGLARIWWDFYRDENLLTSWPDYDEYYASLCSGFSHNTSIEQFFPVFLRKDYFTSSLPWQLKGIAPTISFLNGAMTGNLNIQSQNAFYNTYAAADVNSHPALHIASRTGQAVEAFATNDATEVTDANNRFRNYIANTFGVQIPAGQNQMSFNAADFRAMMAQTRIFERLARTGSRYTEYLHANFGTAPADGVLQRPQYLGGFKFDVAVTEIEQTAQDGENPVGTLRGHGIGNAGTSIQTFHAKEFGMLYGLLDYSVDTQYTQGMPREWSYKKRFDFFNPSFQHLSEQEVRSGEVYYANDGRNDETFGFQAYANELRSGKSMIVGDMRNNLSYWQQALTFGSRPYLNENFIRPQTQSYRKPFAVQSEEYYPIISDCLQVCDVYRPMARYSTPGLVDHL